MEKVVKSKVSKLKKFQVTMLLVTSLVAISAPVKAYAEEEVVYEVSSETSTSSTGSESTETVESSTPSTQSEETVSSETSTQSVETTTTTVESKSSSEETVYEQTTPTTTNDGKEHFYTEEQFQEDLKTNPDLGSEIPDSVQTEAERKGITPDKPTPTPDKPTPTPDKPTPNKPTPTPTTVVVTPTPDKPEQKPVPQETVQKTGDNKGLLYALTAGLLGGATLLGYSTYEKISKTKRMSKDSKKKSR